MSKMVYFNPINDNFLDRSFQKAIFPFQCLHHALFLSRFSIKYNCVRAHGRWYYMFSFFGISCLLLYMYKYVAVMFMASVNSLVDFFLWLNLCFAFLPFVMFYCINIIRRRNHVKIILKIQKAFRIVHYKDYRQCMLWNWFGVFCHVFWVILSIGVLQDISVAASFYIMTYFDVNTTYGNSLIFLIRNGMTAWIAEVEYQCKTCLELEERKRCDHFRKLFQAYEDLMEAYCLFKKLFQFPVSKIIIVNISIFFMR